GSVMNSRIGLGLRYVFLIVLLLSQPAAIPAQEKTPASRNAWTLEEALQQLRLYPRDAYLQYVALQLARRDGRTKEIGEQIDRLLGDNAWGFASERSSRVDLFSLFSGSLAVQESLQLDAMRGQPGRRLQAPRRRRSETSWRPAALPPRRSAGPKR